METRYYIISLLCFFMLAQGGCDRNPSSALKKQANATLTFYGLAIDQDGKPVANVRITYQYDAFPEDWTFDKRGEPLITSTVSSVSNELGRFEFKVKAHTLRRLSIGVPTGYRHLCEEYVGTVTGEIIPSTYGYLISSWGDLCYKSDSDHPAVFVFVKDGIKEVSALPCSGGYNSGNGKIWILNKPAWPKKPSLKDVVQKKPEQKAH